MLTRPAKLLLAVLVASLLGAAPALAAKPTHRTDIIFLRAIPKERAAALYHRYMGPYPGSRIVVGANQNTVICHDTLPRLAEFRELLELIDVPGAKRRRIYVRPVLHRVPTELAHLIAEALGPAVKRAPLVIVADDRGSRLVVSTTQAIYLKIDKIARRLDVRPRDGGRKVRVVPRREEAPPPEQPEP